ncbi:NAD(P)H-dependent oxidoreductase [Galbibacter sp. EGI 63066]|uniref:NADPH-dependent FMN reductase n=1 Tax=Galbibacter sp. EGI 63066 TaxID=2993559 RepID=UPI0022491522|nr:NAD(P)H-dependent oxidoreductase [Galbibacter sp. EGI 63066]MCX2678717.1 NAD(P)H-dependent oxidoreductase [Galbibacter sp. EGI 63066]
MKKVIAFAGSNSSTSINYELVQYTVTLIDNFDIQLLNMANMPFPMFSEDLEKEEGYKNSLIELKEDIVESEGVIISVNEHNGNPSAYFKNLIDWLSRVDRKFLNEKQVFLMGTSGGGRGAIGSITVTQNMLPRFGAVVDHVFSLPSFNDNFSKEECAITNEELKAQHKELLEDFLSKL